MTALASIATDAAGIGKAALFGFALLFLGVAICIVVANWKPKP